MSRVEAQKLAFTFLEWVKQEGWEKHSSGRYYFKLEYPSQWPPKEANTLDETELFDKFMLSKAININ